MNLKRRNWMKHCYKDKDTLNIREIVKNNTRLAILVSGDWNEGLSFFSDENDFQQAGTWCYNKGKKLLAHKHLKIERKIDVTQEVIFIKNGKIRADIYGLNNELVDNLILEKNDCLILLAGGHGYEVLEDNTQVLEVKNGPYLGAEKDRARI
jgi:hypothetical protein